MQDEKISMAAQMQQHIEHCEGCGVCVKQYCKEKNIQPATYYYWRKKLQKNLDKSGGSFIQLQPVAQSSCIEIVFTNGVKIYFENLVSADYLKQLIY